MAARCEQPDPAYAAACSAQTLCSARRGFLRALLPELCALCAPDWLRALEPLPDALRLQRCREHIELIEALNEVMSRVTPLFRGKDAWLSRERRRATEEELARAGGGREGGEGPLDEEAIERALALASEAVLRAPVEDDDEEATLALALWTRSAVLLARGRARGAGGEGGALAALADLKLALRAHLPARMRAHYYWRTGDAYRDCGESTRAKVSYELALRLIRDEQERARLTQALQRLTPAQPPPPAPHPTSTKITLTGGAKLNMPSLSKLIKIVEEEGKGRFAAACAPVHAGDVLLSEPPYAACLLPDHHGTHCLHCFTRLSLCAQEAALWCPRCAGVAFCSQRCKQRASRYHDYECSFQDLFIGSGMSILSHIALRMVTQLGLAAALDAHARHVAPPASPASPTSPVLAHDDIEGGRKAKMKTRKERLNRSKKGLKMSEKNEDLCKDKDETGDDDEEENMELKTAQIYALCTHSEQRTGEDYVSRLVVATFLTECLFKAKFFDSCAPEDLENSRWAVTALLVRNLQLLQFNAHEVFETLRAGGAGGHVFKGARAQHVAVAIYPTGALFNHDCFPSVARYFVGRRLVLTATRALRAGAAAAECYGPAAALRPAPARRRALAARYWFTCACDACARPTLWPTLAECRDTPPPLKCLTADCGGVLPHARAAGARCASCGVTFDAPALARRIDIIEDCHALFQEGAQLMEQQRVSEAREVLCGALERFHSVAAAPRRAAYLAHEALRAVLATAGNQHYVRTTQEPTSQLAEEPPADT